MATRVKVLRNTFNKSQYKKYETLLRLVWAMIRESYPNGNSGYAENDVQTLFGHHSVYPGARFEHLVVSAEHGDPHSCGFYVVDPSRLSKQDMEDIEFLLSPTADNKTTIYRRWQQKRPYATPATSIPLESAIEEEWVWKIAA